MITLAHARTRETFPHAFKTTLRSTRLPYSCANEVTDEENLSLDPSKQHSYGWKILPVKIREVRRRECRERLILLFPPWKISRGLGERKPPGACTMMSRLAVNTRLTRTTVKTCLSEGLGYTPLRHVPPEAIRHTHFLLSSYHTHTHTLKSIKHSFNEPWIRSLGRHKTSTSDKRGFSSGSRLFSSTDAKFI